MSNRTILITGCSTGIGRDAAETLVRRGWTVFAACRKPEDAERMADFGAIGVQLDYEDPASIEAAVAVVLDRTGGTLDALFNNGAYAIPGPVEDLTREAMSAVMNANFLGWHDLTVRLIPAMRANGRGRIVNNSSVLGLVVAPLRGAYCATKFAVEAWSDALRMEMRDANITVSLIEPGPIQSDFRKNAIAQFRKWVDWENSARVEEYRRELNRNIETGSSQSRFKLPASAVTAKLIDAIENPRPAPRYYVTTPTYAIGYGRRFLPTRALDWILERG